MANEIEPSFWVRDMMNHAAREARAMVEDAEFMGVLRVAFPLDVPRSEIDAREQTLRAEAAALLAARDSEAAGFTLHKKSVRRSSGAFALKLPRNIRGK